MLDKFPPVFDRTFIPLIALVISLSAVSHAATAPSVTILTPPVTKNVGSPLRVVFDVNGDFWVADPRVGGVSKFDAQGNFIRTLKTQAPPQGIAISSDGSLLVSQVNSVVVLGQDGAELGRLGSGAGQFRKANGIAIDSTGFIYAVDSLDNNVKVFTAAGRFVRTIGIKGNGDGQFSMPTGIAYEKSTNQIAVTDTLNSRVQFFSASGNYDFIKSIGTFGVKPLQFRSPVGVTFDYDASGKLNRMYVADTRQNNIQVIDPADSGKFLANIGNNGFANGQLAVPVDVAFDQFNQRIAVANSYGNITMYGIDGGATPADNAVGTLNINPVPQQVATNNITIAGTVDSYAKVVVTANTAAIAAPVTYVSANTWNCSISGLVAGSNELTVTATDSNGAVAKQALAITYTP